MAYFDIYVSICPTDSIRKEQLQLIALSSLMMATKVEEFKCLPMEDVRFLCDEIFTEDQILLTEKSIIEVLEWKCYRDTPNMWLLRFLHILNKTITKKEFSLCTRLLDLATFDLEYLNFPNSIFAAACIKLVISVDIFPLYCHPKFSLKLKNCTFWLSKYLQNINVRLNSSNEKFINYKTENEICLRLPHLSLIQSYDSNIDIFNKKTEVNFIHSDKHTSKIDSSAII
ncbi:hypothetical protein O3M35_000255 [Rhynocoris fuscipes]|uniref:Uncharacterized protein n=1 Tax=Rhynocoris fuscipes TaxID=488301 RepID=A0AAW1DL14_9HEMI